LYGIEVLEDNKELAADNMAEHTEAVAGNKAVRREQGNRVEVVHTVQHLVWEKV